VCEAKRHAGGCRVFFYHTCHSGAHPPSKHLIPPPLLPCHSWPLQNLPEGEDPHTLLWKLWEVPLGPNSEMAKEVSKGGGWEMGGEGIGWEGRQLDALQQAATSQHQQTLSLAAVAA